MKTKISEQIKIWRKYSRVSQLSLSEKIGVTRQTIVSWENGTRFPSDENIKRLSETFGLKTPNDIFLSPQEYDEKYKRQNETVAQLDASNFSAIHPFQGLSDSWETSDLLGFRVFGVSGPGRPTEYHFVYWDSHDYEDQGIPYGSMVVVRENPSTEAETDEMLVWNSALGKAELQIKSKIKKEHLILGKKLKVAK